MSCFVLLVPGCNTSRYLHDLQVKKKAPTISWEVARWDSVTSNFIIRLGFLA